MTLLIYIKGREHPITVYRATEIHDWSRYVHVRYRTYDAQTKTEKYEKAQINNIECLDFKLGEL